MMQKRMHSRECKLDVMRQIATGQKRPAQVCREYGLAESVFSRWRIASGCIILPVGVRRLLRSISSLFFTVSLRLLHGLFHETPDLSRKRIRSSCTEDSIPPSQSTHRIGSPSHNPLTITVLRSHLPASHGLAGDNDHR